MSKVYHSYALPLCMALIDVLKKSVKTCLPEGAFVATEESRTGEVRLTPRKRGCARLLWLDTTRRRRP